MTTPPRSGKEGGPVNQCDGCARGLPVDENGLHFKTRNSPFAENIKEYVMGCTAERYAAEGSPMPGERGEANE